MSDVVPSQCVICLRGQGESVPLGPVSDVVPSQCVICLRDQGESVYRSVLCLMLFPCLTDLGIETSVKR